MNVSGIRPYEGFYQYNSIKLNELRSQQIVKAQQEQQAMQQEEPALAAATQEPANETMSQSADTRSFDSYDFAQQYRPDETYSLKGIESDINSLDAEKAVSDLDKDQVLEQYQYFVGDSAYVTAKQKEPSEIMPRSGENFIL